MFETKDEKIEKLIKKIKILKEKEIILEEQLKIADKKEIISRKNNFKLKKQIENLQKQIAKKILRGDKMKEKDEYVYKIRDINTNEVWLGDSNGVIEFAKYIAENKRSIDKYWMEEHRLQLQDIGFDFKSELNKFITDFKTAKSFLEIGDEYVISEIGDKMDFLELLENGYFASTNTEE